MQPKIEFSGFEGLEDALIELEQFSGRTNTGKNAVRRGMRNAMKRLENKAKALAPVDRGDLRDSIKTKNAKARRRRGSVKFQRETGISMLTGPTVIRGDNYGYFQEFGTVHAAPQPFMRPAADSEGENVIAIVSDELRDAIDKSLARARKKAAKAARDA